MALTRQEQISMLKEQIQFLNKTEVELAARKHKLQESLNKLLDENQIANNKAMLKHQK